MPNRKLELSLKYLTASQVPKRLGLSRFQFDVRLKRGILPRPTFTDVTGVRYFDESWVRVAQSILDSSIQDRGIQ
jgi:predicted DNA-binding transcriptional regulator AlpA